MDFVPKKGCPMCGIVAQASQTSTLSPISPSFAAQQALAHEILWKDDNFTAYRERAYPVSSRAHIVVVFNLHVPSLYSLSSSDVPLLVSLKALARRLLQSLAAPPPSPAITPAGPSSSTTHLSNTQEPPDIRIGFITPPFKDNKIPVKDHLHAHAYIAPLDLAGWWRGVAYGPLAWYAVDDLIAEIRESTTNNRVKSGYENRSNAPIDSIPAAGARSGTADGHETTETGLGIPDVEAGERSPTSPRSPLTPSIPPRVSPSPRP